MHYNKNCKVSGCKLRKWLLLIGFDFMEHIYNTITILCLGFRSHLWKCYSLTQFVLCDIVGHPEPEVYLGGKNNNLICDSSSLLPPISHLGGAKFPCTLATDSSSFPVYYSMGAEGSGGGSVGKFSPTLSGVSAGLTLQLNPTTLALLQQHNYIPYFRGIKACVRQMEMVDELLGSLPLSNKIKMTKILNQRLSALGPLHMGWQPWYDLNVLIPKNHPDWSS